MKSPFLKVEVVLEDLIALGNGLKIMTIDEFKRSESVYIRYLFLTGYLRCCLTKISKIFRYLLLFRFSCNASM